MAAPKDVLVPDIGDFKDIPVIEVLVKPGDHVKAEESLITLESDKATMEVPAPFDGVIKELRVKVGDDVSEGTVILSLEEASPSREPQMNEDTPTAPAHLAPTAPTAPTAPAAPTAICSRESGRETFRQRVRCGDWFSRWYWA